MKSLKSFGKPRKPEARQAAGPRRMALVMVRRVSGDSMAPTLLPGRIVIGISRFRQLHTDDIVIVRHDGLEKIKRIAIIRDSEIFLLGDNLEKSTDSRSFGWLPAAMVQGKVIWPLHRRKRP